MDDIKKMGGKRWMEKTETNKSVLERPSSNNKRMVKLNREVIEIINWEGISSIKHFSFNFVDPLIIWHKFLYILKYLYIYVRM